MKRTTRPGSGRRIRNNRPRTEEEDKPKIIKAPKKTNNNNGNKKRDKIQ